MFVGRVLDLANDLSEKVASVNGFGVQALVFAFCDFLEVFLIEAHFLGVGIELEWVSGDGDCPGHSLLERF